MKRTVTANISGIVFHIEEDAYKRLERYLDRIREHLSHEEGLDEIMDDIEVRVAELFQEATGQQKEVVTDADVERVIETLGQPEAFSDGEQEESTENAESEEGPAEKRVYRNPDDKVLGGVCSGISAYMGWDPLWLRLGFVIAALLAGTGPLLYIILWIIIPEARTRSEKLHMRGKAVNLDNLKQKVKEEGDELKDRFGRFKEEMKSEEVKGEGRKLGKKLKELFQGILYWIGKAGKKLGGAFLIFLGLVFALVLMVAFGGGGDHFTFIHTPEVEYSFNEFVSAFLPEGGIQTLFKTGFALTIGIPVLFFFYTGTKALFELHGKWKGLGPVLFILWLLGIVAVLYAGAYGYGTQLSG